MNHEAATQPASRRLSWFILAVVGATSLMAQTDWSTIGLGQSGHVPAPIRLLSRVVPIAGLAVLLLVCRHPASRLLTGPARWFSALAAWSLVVAFWSPSPIAELERGTWFFSGVMTALWAGAELGWARVLRLMSTLLTAFVAAGVVVEVVFGPYPTLPGFETGDGLFGLHRFRGFTYAPNVLASYAAVLVLSAGIPLILGDRSKRLAGMLVVGMFGLGLTQSRVAVLAVASGLALLEVRRTQSIRRVLMLAAPIAVLALIGIGLMGGGVGSLSRNAESSDLSNLVGRTQLWHIASDLIAARPVTGRGAVAVERRFENEVSDGYLGWNPVSSHNLVLNAWASYGLVGLLLLVGLFSSMIRCTGLSPPVGWEVILAFVLLIGLTESVLEGVPTVEIVLLAVAAGSMSSAASDRQVLRRMEMIDA